MNSQDFATRLIELRRQTGLSQEDLAYKADISYSAVSKLEQGTIKNPSIWTVLSLCEALSIGLDEMLMIGTKTASNAQKAAPAPITLVVFDLHGVLIEGLDDLFPAMASKFNVDPHRLEELFWQFDDDVALGKLSVEILNERIRRILNIPQFNYFEFYVEHFQQHSPIQSVLQQIKASGRKVALLTMIYPEAYGLLEKIGKVPPLADFDATAFSYDIGEQKPDNEYYRAIESKTGVESRQILYIDDTKLNIDHAQKHGWQTALYDQACFEDGLKEINQYLGL
ncbi:TPA: helix-turn-helix domain-containing protein [Candidatus Saccharibacteria bacterium]|nr:helix-turn-helix domain-containing protein [Candidatus Saccharibacteria bacterium]